MVRPIEHSGVVERTAPDAVYVRITSRSACGACRARQACGLAETQEKIVAVKTADAPHYPFQPIHLTLIGFTTTGVPSIILGLQPNHERVQGHFLKNVLTTAAPCGITIALAVLLAVLFAANAALGWSEGASALAALGGVGLYYVVLWLCLRRIEHTIHFTITKI